MAQNKILNIEPIAVPNAVGNLLNCSISAPAPNQNPVVGSTSGGTLAAATYFYKVSALVTRPDQAIGESLPSNEQQVTNTGATSSNTISWGAVPGATGYRVYRGTSSNGENVYYLPGAVTTFVDTGAANTGGSPLAASTAIYGVIPAGPSGPTGYIQTQPYLIVKHMRASNKTAGPVALTCYKGANGAQAAGTEFGFVAAQIGANSSQDWYGQTRFDAIDYLTGVAGAASSIVLQIDAEIGVS